MRRTRLEPWVSTYLNLGTLVFWGFHLVAIAGAIWVGITWKLLGVAVACYFARMFFVTAGYHRYFSHRTFKTSRVFQALLAFGAESSLQRGVLWWSAKHRRHHRFSDVDGDTHSPTLHGFWWSHIGWSTSPTSAGADYARIGDLTQYPELRLLDRYWLWPPVLFALALLLLGGWPAVVWGFFVSTVLLWHGTFTINSLAHIIGRRRFHTKDDSRNNWVLALVTMGEGWHNNHHHYMSSCNQGFRWYEIDLTYYILRCLSLVRIVWDVRRAPKHITATP